MTCDPIIPTDPNMQRVFDVARRLARSDEPVLIVGEPGTGRSVVAKYLHDQGESPQSPFVALDCEAQENLVFLEAGGRGTAFLSGVEWLHLALQDLLAEHIEAGGTGLRIVCSAEADIQQMTDRGLFRERLYDLLTASSSVAVPPLRDHSVDIPTLLDGFLGQAGAGHLRLAEAAMGYLFSYDWPGNIGELEQLASRFADRVRSDIVTVDDLPPQIRWSPARSMERVAGSKDDVGLNPMSEEFQFRIIADALRRTQES